MKINICEIRDILKAIDKEQGWLLIPLNNDLDNLEIYDGTFIYYSFSNDLIELEYSEDGLDFNLYSDWYVVVDSKGKFKGKGSIRHKEDIENSIKWFNKVVYNERLHVLLDYYPK